MKKSKAKFKVEYIFDGVSYNLYFVDLQEAEAFAFNCIKNHFEATVYERVDTRTWQAVD